MEAKSYLFRNNVVSTQERASPLKSQKEQTLPSQKTSKPSQVARRLNASSSQSLRSCKPSQTLWKSVNAEVGGNPLPARSRSPRKPKTQQQHPKDKIARYCTQGRKSKQEGNRSEKEEIARHESARERQKWRTQAQDRNYMPHRLGHLKTPGRYVGPEKIRN